MILLLPQALPLADNSAEGRQFQIVGIDRLRLVQNLFDLGLHLRDGFLIRYRVDCIGFCPCEFVKVAMQGCPQGVVPVHRGSLQVDGAASSSWTWRSCRREACGISLLAFPGERREVPPGLPIIQPSRFVVVGWWIRRCRDDVVRLIIAEKVCCASISVMSCTRSSGVTRPEAMCRWMRWNSGLSLRNDRPQAVATALSNSVAACRVHPRVCARATSTARLNKRVRLRHVIETLLV